MPKSPMTKRMALIAASAIALSAHANAQEAEAIEPTPQDGAFETTLSEEQPPLEGDSPFVDDADVAESEAYGADNLDDADEPLLADDATGLDEPMMQESEPLVADGDPVMTDADEDMDSDADPMVAQEETDEIPLAADGIDEDELMTAQDDMDADGDIDGDAMAAEDADADMDMDDASEPMMAEETEEADDAPALADAEIETETRTAEEAEQMRLATSDEPIPAKPTDAAEAAVEQSLIAGTYDVTIPNQSGTKRLVIEGKGTEAGGTFDGQPIDVIVTGRNFSFDAPVTMDGEEQLMTFAGTVEDGVIDNGVIEAQGDGGFMTFDAVRADASADVETDTFGAEADMDAGMDAGADAEMDAEALETEGDASFEADTDTDAAIDADTDVDAGADMDTSIETEADVNADMETDSLDTDSLDTDTSVDAEADALETGTMETDVDADLSGDTMDSSTDMMGSETESDVDTTLDTDFDADAETMDMDADATVDTDASLETETDAMSDSDRLRDAMADDAMSSDVDVTTETETETTIGGDADAPSGVMRSGTTDLGEEPLSAEGDTFTDGDTGYGDTTDDGEAETEVDADTETETEDEDPNFDY